MPSHLLLCLLSLLAALGAVEAPMSTFSKNNVTVTITVESVGGDRAVLVGRFEPDRETPPLHLYSIDLPMNIGGMPTRMDIQDGAMADGPLTADRTTHDLDGLAVYPDGPVTLRQPIRLPDGPVGGTAPATLLISYMACSTEACKRPVNRHALVVTLPTAPRAATPAASVDPALVSAAVREALSAERPAVRQIVADEVGRALAAQRDNADGVRFAKATSVAHAERLIADAHAAGRSAILDFTGPSCTVCQRMARTVLRDPRAIAAWNAQVAIEIDTDTHADLADWQVSRFKTQNRPLYVRIDPPKAGAAAAEARWSQVFLPEEAATMDAFLAWSAGGAGADAGLGDGLWSFLLLAFAGGLFTLVMPCTYPMIPFTVNFFAKQATGGKGLVPLAAFYAGGIILCFVGVGVLVTGVLHLNLAQLSGHPLTNLLLGLLFLGLGLSLLGAFLLHLPPALENALGGGRAGYLGALGMGLTFAITAFACTAPFAGAVLTAAVSSGTTDAWVRAILGMGIYSGVVAVPFFFLAISPGLLKKLPRAGGWMNEFKIVGGIVEIAAAFKFLNIADHHWHWGLFGRDAVFAIWAACSLAIATYVLGRLRFNGDDPVNEIGAGRLLTAIVFAAVGIWIASGVFGNDLGLLESFLAPEP